MDPRAPAPTQMSLAVLIQGTGAHPASWRHTGEAGEAGASIDYYVNIARLAERGRFDLFFVADTPAARTTNLEAWSRFPIFMNVLEPTTLMAAVAMATTRIGVGGTASTSFTEPYNVARQFASVDHISKGRAGWNVVTSANDFAARNFGLDRLPPHGDRYARAHEFVAVVKALWDSWEDDAFADPARPDRNFDPAKLHVLDHAGPHFRVHGALNVARTPQGHPVIIEAGASEAGKAFAAETAEVVFGSEPTIEAGRRFYEDVKGRLDGFGRKRDSLKVLAGLPMVVGRTREEAEAKYQALQAEIPPEVGLMRLGQDLEADLSGLPLDEPIPEDRIPARANHHTAYFNHIVDMVRTEKLTLRETYLRYERGLRTFRGSPEDCADHMEAWIAGGAADGFMLLFHEMPGGLRDFVDLVVPILQARGLFRQDYGGTTLRDHLGLQRPASRHARPPGATV